MSKYGIDPTPSEVMSAIVEKHKLLRKKQGLSQQELARRSGVSFGSIKRFESIGQISFESLLKIAHVLNRLNDFESVFEVQNDLEKIKQMFSDKTK